MNYKENYEKISNDLKDYYESLVIDKLKDHLYKNCLEDLEKFITDEFFQNEEWFEHIYDVFKNKISPDKCSFFQYKIFDEYLNRRADEIIDDLIEDLLEKKESSES